MNVTIRTAVLPDVSSLADLWKAMVEHHRRVVRDEWPVLPAEVAWARRAQQYAAWLAEGSGFILVADLVDTQQPAGYLACRLLEAGPTFDLGEIRGDIDSLVTAETARGHGVGSALLSACWAELRSRGVRYCSIGVVEANTDAVRLYERHGFRPFVRTMLAEIPHDHDAESGGTQINTGRGGPTS